MPLDPDADHPGQARSVLLDLYRQALAAVHGRRVVADWLRRHPPRPYHLVALGKAAAAMATGALEAAPQALEAGLLVTRRGYLNEPALHDPRLVCLEAGHPVPDAQSLAAGSALQRFLENAPASARFLFLISGGTSSIVELPVPGVSLEDLQRLNLWLLHSGLPIGDINRVRSAVSLIKGGRLAAVLRGREALQLLMSDVPGDVAGDIGSGLLIPAQSQPLPRLPPQFGGLPLQAPPAGAAGKVQSHIIASNHHARAAAAAAATRLGHAAYDHGPLPLIDAAACGEALAGQLLSAPAGVHIWGGETTVKLPDHPGQGGRNQHLALAAARVLAGAPDVLFLAAATDGSDGVTDDAGALVDGGTLARGRDAGYDAADCLKRAAAAEFLEGSGDLLHTGPTGTNVMDLVIACKVEN